MERTDKQENNIDGETANIRRLASPDSLHRAIVFKLGQGVEVKKRAGF